MSVSPFPSDTAEGTDPSYFWSAVLQRNNRFDGIFWYGVTSTGIYCRPGCPSRRPRADRVRFFASCAAAEGAGFRPCLRCRPQAAEAPAAADVVAACRLLAAAVAEGAEAAEVTVEAVAASLGVSASTLHRRFRAVLGCTPAQVVEAFRMEVLRRLLRQGDGVASATYGAGFGSASRVYERSAAHLGMTPAAYARGGAGETLGAVVVPTPLGALLVAGTCRGLSAVRLGDDGDALWRELAAEFPAATIAEADPAVQAWAAGLSAWVAGARAWPQLPVDVRGTAFQRRVWEALQEIPAGATITYRDLAARIARPTAVRAVARAVACNPVALAVPCHRVVPAAGGTGGYRWGPERKARLLAREREE
ncbi:bifunctional DNA-binding transcriptional regulator/O6-methylguanine-DNA methyltransferase Ada [Caenispirillum bisanense]